MEVINAYSEQNDPLLQKQAFMLQNQMAASQEGSESAHKDDELHRNDQDFLESLTYGMPPTAGWGCGIDRLAMLFCGTRNIKEVILFPAVKNITTTSTATSSDSNEKSKNKSRKGAKSGE